jgi:hypothetical protein
MGRVSRKQGSVRVAGEPSGLPPDAARRDEWLLEAKANWCRLAHEVGRLAEAESVPARPAGARRGGATALWHKRAVRP